MRQALAIKIVHCRQAKLQTNIEKNISGSCEVLYLQELGREQIVVVPERCIMCEAVKRYPEQASFFWEVKTGKTRNWIEEQWKYTEEPVHWKVHWHHYCICYV